MMRNYVQPFFLCIEKNKPVLLWACMLFVAPGIKSQAKIFLSANDKGRVFEGIGAVSAGASSRSLIDYPEKERSEVLDYLFKPKFGAGFQHLKVEIGGGENSTCGSEPSHAITKNEISNPVPRGYEFWLMAEARKRNPGILLDCLPWTYPSWVGNPFSKESAGYVTAFLEVARKQYGIDLDWVSAGQNEMAHSLKWVAQDLRPMMNAHGFSKVKIQAPDDSKEYWEIFDELEKQPEYNQFIDAVGYHYLDGREPWEIDQNVGHNATDKAKLSGKPIWASEEWSNSGRTWNGKGALYVARLMNKLYTRDRATKFEIWCPFTGIYNSIFWSDVGVLQANSAWDGHYTVWSALWAVAHTAQFAEPGWVYMDNACGKFDSGTWNGSHVALRNPKTGDWSVIMVSGKEKNVNISVGSGLKKGPVYLWVSTEKEQFIRQVPQNLHNNSIELHLEPDAIYTLTTTTGQQKGTFTVPPPAKAFPFPFSENFDEYNEGETPRYFSDQKGTFETCASPGGGQCLMQLVPKQGILWWGNGILKPHTLFGDDNWQDYTIAADVKIDGGDVEIGGRHLADTKLGYRWILTSDGRWQLNWEYRTIASGQIEHFDAAVWHHLQLELKGDEITGFIDKKKLVTIADKSGTKGMAFIACTYNRNLFDNIHVEAASPE